MASSFDEWKKKQAASASGQASSSTANTRSGFDAWRNKKFGIATPEQAPASATPAKSAFVSSFQKDKAVKQQAAADAYGPKKIEPAIGPKKESYTPQTTFNRTKEEAPAPSTPEQKPTFTQRVLNTVKEGASILGKPLASGIINKATNYVGKEAYKNPEQAVKKSVDAAWRGAVSLLGSTVSAARYGQEKIQQDPTALRDPVTKFVLKFAGGEAIDKKITQLSQWAAKYDPTGPMLKRADESLKAYQERISPITEDYQRAPLKEKFTTRLPETLYNYLPETAGAMVPYMIQPELGAVMMFGDTANQVKQDALAHGVEPQQAELLAVRTAAAVSMLDRLGVGEIAPKVKGKILQNVLSATKKLWSFSKEPLTESAQEVAQIMAEKTFKDVGLPEAQERILTAGFLGIFFDQGMKGVGLARQSFETKTLPDGFDKLDNATQAEFLQATEEAKKEQAVSGTLSEQTANKLEAVFNKVDEAIAKTQTDEIRAGAINEIFNSPINEDTVTLTEEIGSDPDMRLAFKQSMVDLNDANDPALEQSTREQGLVFKRVTEQNDPILKDFESLPAFYDPSAGQIVFNEAIIAKTLKHLADGKVIIVGDGKLVNYFVKKEGESLAELKTRYETELIKHEIAHVKTITQEDINRYEQLQAQGKTAEAQRLKVNLEERANRYTVENAKTALDQSTADIIEKVIQREQNKSDSTQQLELNAYARSEKEDGYKAWKRLVSRETNLVNANFDEIQSYLGPKEANKRFEDALDRQDVVGGDYQFDELIATFQKRYAKESVNKSTAKSTKEQSKEVAEAFKKLPERIKKAIASEIKAARKSGSTVDADTLRKRITERVLKAEQRHLERGPMRKRLQSIERTRTMKSIRKLVRAARTTRTLSGNKKAKISVDAQRLINGSKKDGILGIAKVLGMNRKKVLAQVTQEMIDWREKNPEAIELPEAMAINIQIAESAGIAQQTIRELRETEAFIKGIVEDGKADRLSVVEKIRERNTNFVESVKEHLTGNKDYKPEGLVRSDAKVKPSLATGRGMFWGSAPVGDFARRLGKQAERLFADTVSANEQTKAHVNRVWSKIEAMGVDVYGGAKNYHNSLKKDASNVINLGEFTNARGETKKLELSRLQAMGIYASKKDAKYLQNLTDEKGNAFTPEMMEASDSLLSKQDKEYITKVVEIAYKGQYKRFAEAVQQASGVDLGFTENYAGSIYYETNPEEDIENPAVDLINSSLQKHVTGIQNSAKKSRTNFIGEMKLTKNPIFDAMRYVAATEHFINMHDKIGKWEALLKDRNTREAMEKKVGKEFTFLLEQHIEDIRSGGLSSQQIDSTNKLIDQLMGNVSGALLASPGVWAGQSASILQFKAEAGIGPGFVDGIRKHKELLPILKKYAPSVDARIMENANQVLAEIGKDPTKINTVLSGIQKMQGVPLDFMDKMTTLAGTLGMFEVKTRKYMKQGLTQEQAYEAAGRDVNLAIVNTQSTKSALGKSYWEKRNNTLKLITGLRNQPNKMARATFDAIGKLKKGEITPAEFIHFQVYASILQPIMYTAVRHTTKQGIRAGKIAILNMVGTAAAKAIADKMQAEQDDDEENYWSSVIAGITSQALGFFMLGDLANILMANKFQGKNYEYRPAVITTVMQDALDALKAFTSGESVNSRKTGLLKGLRAVSRSLGVGDPLGLIPIIQDAIKYDTAQIKKTPEYKRAQKIKNKEKALKEKEKEKEKARK